MTVEAVAIADSEEMQPKLASHVWTQNVAVLVWLVGVARLMPNARRKSKLGDAVELLCRHS